jgi:hypothetical protein
MTKPRRRSAVVVAAVAALLVAGAFATRASASWYITQAQARHDAVQVTHDRYGLNRFLVYVECTPRLDNYGRRHYPPRHRWVCVWNYSDGSSCDGILLIRGSNHAAFSYEVYSGQSCDEQSE